MPKKPDNYAERVEYWYRKHKAKPKAQFKTSYLYHATGESAFKEIQKSGLLPRNPEWFPDKKKGGYLYDASKDGYLSFATTISGAGAMGGKVVLLRMKISNVDLAPWDFRVHSMTEVRTQVEVPPEMLDYSTNGGKDWQALK